MLASGGVDKMDSECDPPLEIIVARLRSVKHVSREVTVLPFLMHSTRLIKLKNDREEV